MYSIPAVPAFLLRKAGAHKHREPSKMQNERLPGLFSQSLKQPVSGWCFLSNINMWREAGEISCCVLFATPAFSF